MTENHNNGNNDQEPEGFDAGRIEENENEDSGIIELSDIAIGIGPEDDTIIELTEEIIVKSRDGISGAASEVMDQEEIIDLSEAASSADVLESR